MLKGLGQLGDMAKIMKQAQEMQAKMAEVQARLDAIEVTGEAGAGLVKATATAKGELKALSIDPSLFAPEEREVVEDLIVAAVQDAQARAQAAAQEEMAQGHRGPRPAAGHEAAVLRPPPMADQGAAAVDRLIALMARLPGLGPRSARRAVLALIRKRAVLLEPLAQALGRGGRDGARMRALRQHRHRPISAASAPTRAARPARSAWSRRSPTSGRWSGPAPSAAATTCSAACCRRSTASGPRRCASRSWSTGCATRRRREVILALNATVDGQTTAHYIADELEPPACR